MWIHITTKVGTEITIWEKLLEIRSAAVGKTIYMDITHATQKHMPYSTYVRQFTEVCSFLLPCGWLKLGH